MQADKPRKERLDKLLVERGLAESRQQAQRLIMAGRVRRGDTPMTKSGVLVPCNAELTVLQPDNRYVSRGGEKLQAALDAWQIDLSDQVCLDVGASTGGFTDCMLQHGARRVYAIDVGYGQFALSLRNDPRVTLFERTNIRTVPPDFLPEQADFAAIDVSFISLRLVLPAVLPLVKSGGELVCLVKPQFEAGRAEASRGAGVIRDPAVHAAVLAQVKQLAGTQGLELLGEMPSPLLGPAGNREFLCRFRKT